MLKKRRAAGDGEMTLNITSLMDILTIVLIFLVMSFSSEENEVSVPKDIELPQSTTERQSKVTVKLSISDQEVRVEDSVVTKLRNGKIPPSELNKYKQIESLLKVLKRAKAQVQSSARSRTSSGTDDDEAEIVYLEAQKGLEFGIIDRVLKTAAAAGFAKFRLAVVRKI